LTVVFTKRSREAKPDNATWPVAISGHQVESPAET
jgi:hypothetical protein